MKFRLLGPVEVWEGGRQVPLRGPLQRTLLAVLLLHANRVVPTTQLIDLLWGPDPPKTVRTGLQGQVWRLRRTLATGAGGDSRLAFQPAGYRLSVHAGELDLDEFNSLVNQGKAALAAGHAEAASATLRAALALWRGRMLEDVEAPGLRGDVAQLEERRVSAMEDRVEADLRVGRHSDLVGELEVLVDAHPLRERLRYQQMLALYRSGRPGDALDAFNTLRVTLRDELGLDPGPDLGRLQRAILARDPTLEPPSGAGRPHTSGRPPDTGPQPRPPPVPLQLPPDIATFTGRVQEVTTLRRLLEPDSGRGTAAVAAVAGIGGIGKSALAIHAAHRLAGRFPDGQLYASLQGAPTGQPPLDPAEVLGRFLRALGLADTDIPAILDESAARFRAVTATRRLLVVLDNAHDAAQVRPLLPSTPTCAVLVTSRQVLATLDGAEHVHLEGLSPAEAVELLGRLVGQERVTAELPAAGQVAKLCGYLPLALRIAGAKLASRPAWKVQTLAERLSDERHRLDELAYRNLAVRASFMVSFQNLSGSADPDDSGAARAYQMLGLLDGPDASLQIVARLLDRSEPTAERLLERLVDVQLLETPAPRRYRLHDLLRLFAHELATERLPAGEQTAAVARALGSYLASARNSFATLRPGDQRLSEIDPESEHGGLRFPDAGTALAWIEAERMNLVAAVRQAAATPGIPASVSAQLAGALFGFFVVRGYWQSGIEVNDAALPAARRAGDRVAEAQILNDVGAIHQRQGEYDRAQAALRESVAIFRALGHRRGLASSLTNLGILQDVQGQDAEALRDHQDSVALFRTIDDRYGLASSLTNLGLVHQRARRYPEATRCHLESLAIRQGLGDRYGQASSLTNLGILYRQQGRYDQALTCDRGGLDLFAELGLSYGQGACLQELGSTLQKVGQPEQARAHWERALEIFEQLGAPQAASVRALLDGRDLDAATSP